MTNLLKKKNKDESPFTSWTEHCQWLNQNPDVVARNEHDKLWRVSNLYPIRNKKGQIQRLTLNKHQIKLLHKVGEAPTKPLCLLKSRQIGGTTLFAVVLLDEVCMFDGVSAAIVAHLDKAVKDIFRIVTFAFDHMYPVFKRENVKEAKRTATEIFVPHPENGSRIEVQLEIRSKAITHILWSERAFMKEDRITATTGAITKGAVQVFESTPNGINAFKRLYEELKEVGRSMFVAWFEHDEYRLKGAKIKNYSPKEMFLKKTYNLDDEQLAFRRQKILEMTELKFRQEFPENDTECFLLSGLPVIDRFLIAEQKRLAEANPPIEEYLEDNTKIKIYKKFTKEELRRLKPQFNIGVDPAEGVGQDYSTACVIANYADLSYQVVMTLRGFAPPTNLARLVFKWAKRYAYTDELEQGDHIDIDDLIFPDLIPERNNHGHAFLVAITELENCLYPRDSIYMHKDGELGFVTTFISKQGIQRDLLSAIQERSITLSDPIICDEIETLAVHPDNKSIKAEEGEKDDMFIATCLAFRGAMVFNMGTAEDIEERKRYKSKKERLENERKKLEKTWDPEDYDDEEDDEEEEEGDIF